MTFFVDGLQPELRKTIARYREDQQHELTLERLVHHAQNEGDALRARIIAEGERELSSDDKPHLLHQRVQRRRHNAKWRY